MNEDLSEAEIIKIRNERRGTSFAFRASQFRLKHMYCKCNPNRLDARQVLCNSEGIHYCSRCLLLVEEECQ